MSLAAYAGAAARRVSLAAPISFLQKSDVADKRWANGSPIPLTFPGGLTEGSVIAVALGMRAYPNPADITDYISAVTATGVTFTRTFSQPLAYEERGTEIWLGEVTSGGTDTIYVDPTASSGNYVAGCAAEFSGLDLDDLVADADGDTNYSHGISSQTVSGLTPAKANSLVLGASYMHQNGVSDVGWNLPPGYTEIDQQEDTTGEAATIYFCYRILDSADPFNLTIGSSSNDLYGRCVAGVILNGL